MMEFTPCDDEIGTPCLEDKFVTAPRAGEATRAGLDERAVRLEPAMGYT